MFGAGRVASASSPLSGHGLCPQYPCLRPVVATAGARPKDCKMSETLSSRGGGDRQQTLLCCPSLPTTKEPPVAEESPATPSLFARQMYGGSVAGVELFLQQDPSAGSSEIMVNYSWRIILPGGSDSCRTRPKLQSSVRC
jgi:hypothetical protein